MSVSNGPVVGIDLGTTNSVIAVLKDGLPVVLEVDGEKTMPSVVGLAPDGEIIVGRPARNQISVAPERTISSIKRKMGESVEVALGDQKYRPEEISAMILRRLKKSAEEALGEPVTKAVITVPAFFDDHQRHATLNAGKLAGLEVLRIINEPTAAALAYGADRAKRETLIVYDLGGGTFDVSLVQVEDGVVEVKASHGDTHLGGDDFDEALMYHLVKKSGLDIDPDKDPSLRRRLTLIAEEAKIRLSTEATTIVKEEYLAGNKHLDLKIVRDEYENLIRGHIESSMKSVSKSLGDGSMLPGAVDRILLVGGSSRTPLVFERIRALFKKEPHFEIDPDLIVAMGAAIQGGIITGQVTKTVLVDITPHAFGVSVIGDLDGEYCNDIFSPVIEKGSPIPFRKSCRFFTNHEGQEAVEVKVYQGEGQRVGECTFVGDFLADKLDETAPECTPHTVRMELDANGLLTVTVIEEHTGLTHRAEMQVSVERSSINMEASKAKLDAHLGMTPSKTTSGESGRTQSAKGEPRHALLLGRLRRAIDSCEDPDDRVELQALIGHFESSQGEDAQKLAKAENLLYFLE